MPSFKDKRRSITRVLPRTGNPIVVVSGIVEREFRGHRDILLQTRWKPSRDPVYSGLIEIPAGCVEEREGLLSALKREVEEETGLPIRVVGESLQQSRVRSDCEVLSTRPFCCAQQVKGGLPWVSLVFLCRTTSDCDPRAQPEETRSPFWVSVKRLRTMLAREPQSFFPLHFGTLSWYVREFDNGLLP